MEAVQGRGLGKGWWEEREERSDAIIYIFFKKLFMDFVSCILIPLILPFP